jgi:hypothetical protein
MAVFCTDLDLADDDMDFARRYRDIAQGFDTRQSVGQAAETAERRRSYVDHTATSFAYAVTTVG